MKNWRIRTVMAAAACVVALTGCGSASFHPEQSGIYVKKDGSVMGAEIASFDNSAFADERYQESELLTFVEDTVSTYNKECGAQAAAYKKEADDLKVSIDRLEVKSEVATLILSYASVENYLEFNEGGEEVLTLAVQNAPEAVAAGMNLDGLKDAEGNAVDTTAAQTNEKYYVVAVSGNTAVTVDGKIIGVGEGVTVTGKKTATVLSEEDTLILFK